MYKYVNDYEGFEDELFVDLRRTISKGLIQNYRVVIEGVKNCPSVELEASNKNELKEAVKKIWNYVDDFDDKCTFDGRYNYGWDHKFSKEELDSLVPGRDTISDQKGIHIINKITGSVETNDMRIFISEKDYYNVKHILLLYLSNL